MIRHMEQTSDDVCLVGFSATLPNFPDVATFLRVYQSKGLNDVGAPYHPCALQQQFIGATERKAIKRVCYEKVLNQAGKNQMLVFVHPCKETVKPAKFIRDTVIEKETVTQPVKSD
jgi:pre-mRNA-splicing helicase BRR2